MPGRDISAIEFAGKVAELQNNGAKNYGLAQNFTRQWSFMAPSTHFFIDDPEVRGELIGALDVGVAACEAAIQDGSGGDKEKELRLWHGNLAIDVATHRLMGDEPDEWARATRDMNALVDASPTAIIIEKGKMTDASPLPIYTRLSATAMRLYGQQKLAHLNGENSDPATCIEKLIHETIDHQNQLIEVISRGGKMPDVAAIAAGSLFRLLHFSNLLVQWHHSSDGDPRLIRFGLLREHHPGKKRTPQDLFNLAEFTPERSRLLRVRIKRFAHNEQAVAAIRSISATEEIQPLHEKAERVRKLLKRAIDPLQPDHRQQEAREGLTTYFGKV